MPAARDVTRIGGPVLERARRAVAVLRQREDPDLLLMGFVDAAVLRLVTEVEARYPEIASLDDETSRLKPREQREGRR